MLLALLSPCPKLFYSCRCTQQPKSSSIYTPSSLPLSLLLTIHHPEIHTPHFSLCIFQQRRWPPTQSSGHISGGCPHRSIPMWSTLVCPEWRQGARKRLEGLEGTKMDVKWQHLKHKHWIDGRGKRWSSTVHWCNITQVDLFYVNSCTDYFQGFKSLQQKGGPLKEYAKIC